MCSILNGDRKRIGPERPRYKLLSTQESVSLAVVRTRTVHKNTGARGEMKFFREFDEPYTIIIIILLPKLCIRFIVRDCSINKYTKKKKKLCRTGRAVVCRCREIGKVSNNNSLVLISNECNGKLLRTEEKYHCRWEYLLFKKVFLICSDKRTPKGKKFEILTRDNSSQK